MISATLADHPARAEAARDAAMTAHAERAEQGAPPPSAERYRALVDAHFDVIWRSLRGLGVPAGSADDAAQFTGCGSEEPPQGPVGADHPLAASEPVAEERRGCPSASSSGSRPLRHKAAQPVNCERRCHGAWGHESQV
ncbi:hypothetical protein [Sorangium sp. So ce861]|uniref:hypothetical protein n=1 Tax=Sorangium sp. So ce861 TaxID=3133323 RepID=UPI003F61EF1C